MNPVELWKLSVPASSLTRGPSFLALPKRECAISFSIEKPDGSSEEQSLRFDGVEAYKCTYLTSCNAAMFNIAYGKLVSFDQSPWLTETLKTYGKHAKEPKQLHHFMTCFDDGPCYEFICTGFKHSKQ